MLSVKTREHIRRRLEIVGPRWAVLLCGAVSLGVSLAVVSDSLRIVEISDTHGQSGVIVTCATDVNTLVDQAGLTAPSSQDELEIVESNGRDRIHVLRAFTVPVTADGTTTDLVATDETVGELLAESGIEVRDQDIVEPALDEKLERGDSVTLHRVEYVEYTTEEAVPTETEYRQTSLFYRNQDKETVLEQGQDGLDQVTWREIWVDGECTETVEVGRETLVEMQPTVIKCYGEGVPVSIFNGPEVVDGVPVEGVSAVYTGKRSTGYSASLTAKGASGQKLTYGTVAVDPSVIPYGTLLYITSDDGSFVYGYAYAADTGTAMMAGHAFVDLYYETYDEAVTSAVIPVTVYVIDDDTAAAYKEENDAIREADLAEHH
nr:3D domain-containing protein [uncultured Gemmiger sp.]